jgi:hypothetical protein
MKTGKIFIVIVLLSLNLISAKILKVPQEYPSIQFAINAALNQDTVLVSDGIYYENIKFNGKNIVVASNYIFTRDIKSIKGTIINGSKSAIADSGSCVSFNNKENASAVLEGFTLTGGFGTNYKFTFGNYQEGGGIILHYSSATIRNNIISENNIIAAPGAQRGGGGGIASMYGDPLIYNNIIISNSAGYAGGIVLNWSGGKITNNIIYHNTGGSSFGTGGVMIWEPSTHVEVENNTIVGNISLKDAGGININSDISMVKNNIVWANRQVVGKQIMNPQRGSFNNIEDYSDANNISSFPDLLENSFLPADNSSCIDAGDPSNEFNDSEDPGNPGKALSPSKGGIVNDIGAFGGKFSKVLPELNIIDLFVSKRSILLLNCEVGKSYNSEIEILNLSSQKLKIDSITHSNNRDFQLNYSSRILDLFKSDTLKIIFRPQVAGNVYDSAKIFFRSNEGITSVIISIKGKAKSVTGLCDKSNIKKEFELFQNYPNPFNPITKIAFSIPDRSVINLKIFDIRGRELQTLINREMDPGIYDINWQPETELPSGIYFLRLRAGEFIETKKMLYQK